MADKKTLGKTNQKKKADTVKKHKGRRIFCLALAAAIIIAYFIGFAYEDKIDDYFAFRAIETYSKGDVVELGKLTVHFIDVGQGDACLIELPDDKVMLIDAGDEERTIKGAQKKLTNYIEDVNALRDINGKGAITSFDYAVATHSHADHIGSMDYLLKLYTAKTFYRPNDESTYSGFSDPALSKTGKHGFWGDKHGTQTSKIYKTAIETIYEYSDEVIVTNPNDSGSGQNCIKPDLDKNNDLYYEINFYGHKSSYYSNANNYSPIIILEYNGRRVAVSGDAEEKGEAEFVTLSKEGNDRYSAFSASSITPFTVDVIKLGHHGSKTATTQEYIETITDESYRQNIYIVISCGTNNTYQHPHTETLTNINNWGFDDEKVLRTDLISDIVFDLILFEGATQAAVSIGDIVLPAITYPVNFLGIEVRYRTIAGGAMTMVVLLLAAAGFISGNKKQSSKSSKSYSKNVNKK